MKSEFLTKASSMWDFYISEGLNSMVGYYQERELYRTKYGVPVSISKAPTNTGQNSKRESGRSSGFLVGHRVFVSTQTKRSLHFVSLHEGLGHLSSLQTFMATVEKLK